jgi:hypothetical protein
MKAGGMEQQVPAAAILIGLNRAVGELPEKELEIGDGARGVDRLGDIVTAFARVAKVALVHSGLRFVYSRRTILRLSYSNAIWMLQYG